MASLGEISIVSENIMNAKVNRLKVLYVIVFDDTSARLSRKKLRNFNGFGYDEESEEFNNKLKKIQEISLPDLISVCHILNVRHEGTNGDIARRILLFLCHLKEDEEDEDTQDEEDEDTQDEEDKDTQDEDEGRFHARRRKEDDDEEKRRYHGRRREDDDEEKRRYHGRRREDDDEERRRYHGRRREEDEDEKRRQHHARRREEDEDEERRREEDDDTREERRRNADEEANRASLTNLQNEMFHMSFRDVEGSIRHFNGNDEYPIMKWLEDFEETSLLMNWNDLQKLIFAKKSLDGVAKMLIQSEKGITTWTKLKTVLRNEFETKVTSADIHKMLMNRKKNKNETLQEYAIKMREIAGRVNMENEVVMQYIIDGIVDEPSNKIVLYGAKSYGEFKEKLKLYEKIKGKHNVEQEKKNNFKPKEITKNNAGRETGNKSNNARCFGCGDKGHQSKDCPTKAKGIKCFSCNEYGHKAAGCSKPKKDETKAVLNINHEKNSAYKRVRIGNCKLESLVDTGSDISLIRLNEFIPIGLTLQQRTIELVGIGEQKVKTLGCFQTEIEIDNVLLQVEMHVVPNNTIRVPVIIGTDIFKKATLTINQNGVKVTLCSGTTMQETRNEDTEIRQLLKIDYDNPTLELSHIEDAELRKDVRKLCEDYKPRDQNTKLTPLKTRIILKDETPIYQRPRRLSQAEKIEVDKQVKAWLEEGIVRASHSEFASPIVLVKKKNGEIRICQDYRKLNKQIIKDRFPLPLIEDQLDRLRHSTVFSTLDLKNGFFHVPVEEDSRKYTSFITPTGQYEFLKTPFGMCNSPANFQRFINDVFKEHIQNGIVLTYMDDIVILARNEAEAVQNLKTVLKTAEEYGLQIQWKKCQLLCKEINYLGHHVANGKIAPAKEKTDAVVRYPTPRTTKQVQSFLGLTGYFRKFIPNYALIAKPLSDLLKQNSSFIFGPEQEEAFNKLKDALATQPLLSIYSTEAETELHTDASQDGYGAVLMQKNDKAELHPIHYMSKKTSPAERNYCSYELEVLAIINALKKFRHYLLGIQFKIVTDCAAFTMTMKKKELATRVARWALLLEEFNYTIEHRPGTRMKHTDALSRNSVMMIFKNDFIETIKTSQKGDENLNVIIKLLSEGLSYKDYLLKNNLLYKLHEGRELLAVPSKMQYEVIKRIHEDNGHFGVRKTEHIIAREFWIPRLHNKIEDCIKNCIPCILTERKNGKPEGFLNPIQKDDEPLITYHVDHLGPLTATKKGYKYLLVIIDGFSKFTWLYPTKTLTSEEVIEKLVNQQSTFGSPRRIIADRGTAFTSNSFKEYCHKEKIDLVHITTGVPRANGQVERINRIIIPVLSKMSLEDETKWFKNVGKVQQALNKTYQRSVDTSPFELLFGVEMHRPEDLQLKNLILKEFKNTFIDERESLREKARQQILKVQEENKKGFNKRRKEAMRYEVGDLVAIKRTQFTNLSKLKCKFLGPYKVIAVKQHNRYDVQKVGSGDGPKQTSTSADFMKPWMYSKHDLGSELEDELELRDGRDVR